VKGGQQITAWFLPTLGYILLLGATGVTARLALRTISWEQMVLWVPIAYAVFAVLFAVFRGARFPLGAGGGWAAVTAFCAAGALVLLFVALTYGDAGKVVPVSSGYPVITLIGAALFLSEPITGVRVAGTVLVVLGVILLTR
jgi:drug/metabolite transporter (DMT)-like permease